ncbi:hypothetical protein DTQ70_10195 [Runella sp. SP2]|nr:hypothetical protein DTQ70_10195 [Runella sp. SP2]
MLSKLFFSYKVAFCVKLLKVNGLCEFVFLYCYKFVVSFANSINVNIFNSLKKSLLYGCFQIPSGPPTQSKKLREIWAFFVSYNLMTGNKNYVLKFLQRNFLL